MFWYHVKKGTLSSTQSYKIANISYLYTIEIIMPSQFEISNKLELKELKHCDLYKQPTLHDQP